MKKGRIKAASAYLTGTETAYYVQIDNHTFSVEACIHAC